MNHRGQTQGTILGRFSDLGVDVNGLIIPGRLVEGVLARHAINLVVNTDDEEFKIYLAGSASAIRYKGREILLVTQHQIKKIDASQAGILTKSGSHVITSGGLRGYNARSDTDAYDVAAFDFTAPCKDRPELSQLFFNFTTIPPDVGNIDILAILLSGYPSSEQLYEIHENNHLGLARRNVVCHPHSQPTDESLLVVQAERPLDKHPDGMSGGPAFVIQLEGGRPRAYFAGMIVRGGKETFRIIKSGVLFSFLESIYSR